MCVDSSKVGINEVAYHFYFYFPVYKICVLCVSQKCSEKIKGYGQLKSCQITIQ